MSCAFQQVTKNGKTYFVAVKSDDKDSNSNTSEPRYSKKHRSTAEVSQIALKSHRKTLEGLARSARVLEEESDKSAHAKRDGALRDGLENSSTAMDELIDANAKIPSQFIRDLSKTKSFKKWERQHFGKR